VIPIELLPVTGLNAAASALCRNRCESPKLRGFAIKQRNRAAYPALKRAATAKGSPGTREAMVRNTMATKPSLGLTDSTLHSCEDHLGLASVTSRTRGGDALHILKIIRRTVAEFFQDSIPTVAGGITFFFLLALFPAIASVVSFYGLFASRSEIVHDIDLLAGFLPGGALSVLRTELLRLSKEAIEPNLAFFAGSLVAIWSASGGYSAMVEGLNVAYEVKETRSFWRLTANAVFFTLLAIVAGSLALNLGLILPYWIEANTRTD